MRVVLLTSLILLATLGAPLAAPSRRHDNTRNNGVGFQHFDGITARTRHWVLNSELWSDWVERGPTS